jgi:hypothetical protein
MFVDKRRSIKSTQFVPFILSIVAIWILTITKAVSSESCPISRSIYRDGNGEGFQLIFSSPPQGSVSSAIATIKHPQQGEIYRFNVTQSSGYGSIWLSENDPKESDRSFLLLESQNMAMTLLSTMTGTICSGMGS